MAPSLLDMPDIVMDRILGHSGFRSLMCLRKVCRSLRDFIDEETPEVNFVEMGVYLEENRVVFCYKFPEEREKSFFQLKMVEYQRRGTECVMTHDNRTVVFEDKTIQEVFFDDFQFIMKHQKKTLDKLLICGSDIDHDQVYLDFLTRIGEILESQSPVKVENFTTDAIVQEEIMLILPHLDPSSIKQIGVLEQSDNWIPLHLDQIVQLEQWKQCEEVQMQHFIVSPGIEHFCHMKGGYIRILNLLGGDLIGLKEAYSRNPDMTNWHITYDDFSIEEWRVFHDEFDRPVLYNEANEFEKRWFFRLPEGKLLYVWQFDEYNEYFKFTRIENDGDIDPEHIRE